MVLFANVGGWEVNVARGIVMKIRLICANKGGAEKRVQRTRLAGEKSAKKG